MSYITNDSIHETASKIIDALSCVGVKHNMASEDINALAHIILSGNRATYGAVIDYLFWSFHIEMAHVESLLTLMPV